MKKKKIIRTSTVPNSLNNFCRGMLHELSEKYDVVALSTPGPLLIELSEREGVRAVAIPMERRMSPLKDLISLWRLIRVFWLERPYMVHSMTPKAGMLCMVAAWLTRVPRRVHTFTGLVWPTAIGMKRKVLMATDWLTCACATHIIPEGEGVKNDLIHGGITKKPLKVLGYGSCKGVDLEFFKRSDEMRVRSEELRKSDMFTFLYAGRLAHEKGVNELVEAFVRLHHKCPQTRLQLLGRYEDDDPLKLSTKAQIEDVSNNIEALGRIDYKDMPAFYATADCLVLPSYREGFPNTVLEAGAMGLPCIVTDINGSREIIQHGVNGLVVPPKDADALYLAMKQMISDRDATALMAQKARPIIAQRYEASFVRACLYDFYDQIMR